MWQRRGVVEKICVYTLPGVDYYPLKHALLMRTERLYYLFDLHPLRMYEVDQSLFLSRVIETAQLYSIDNNMS